MNEFFRLLNNTLRLLASINLKSVKIKQGICPLCECRFLLEMNNSSRTSEDDFLTIVRCMKCFATPIHMALGTVLLKNHRGFKNLSIYELSAHGAFYKFLNINVPNLTFSEYFDHSYAGEKKQFFFKEIQHQDVHALTFSDSQFDIVTSSGVFEHVPDDAAGFDQIFRVLKPSGQMIMWVPVNQKTKTVERAKWSNGKIQHFCSPIYHDDIYLRTKRSALVFRDYGIDIIQKIKKSGFNAVEFMPVRFPFFPETINIIVGNKP